MDKTGNGISLFRIKLIASHQKVPMQGSGASMLYIISRINAHANASEGRREGGRARAGEQEGSEKAKG